jgi:hypothetical protein
MEEKLMVAREKVISNTLKDVKKSLVNAISEISKIETDISLELCNANRIERKIGVKVDINDLYDLLIEVSRLESLV